MLQNSLHKLFRFQDNGFYLFKTVRLKYAVGYVHLISGPHIWSLETRWGVASLISGTTNQNYLNNSTKRRLSGGLGAVY